jgi:hypothetical protein
MTHTQTYKLGNQGKRGKRIWLEGKNLENFGFSRGVVYTKYFTADSLILYPEVDGKSKVAGKGNHPIIDITSKKIAKHFEGFESVEVTFEKDKITIKGSYGCFTDYPTLDLSRPLPNIITREEWESLTNGKRKELLTAQNIAIIA